MMPPFQSHFGWGHRNRKRVVSTLLAVPTLVLAGSLFYSFYEGWPLLDAVYFSVVTLTTVGFGDLVPQRPLSKMFTVVYILAGVILLGVFLRWIVRRKIEPVITPFIGVQLAGNGRFFARRMDLPTDRGIVVLSVYPDSPADKAGLRPFDVILAVDGREVACPNDFSNAIAGSTIGPSPTIIVARPEGFHKFRLNTVNW